MMRSIIVFVAVAVYLLHTASAVIFKDCGMNIIINVINVICIYFNNFNALTLSADPLILHLNHLIVEYLG